MSLIGVLPTPLLLVPTWLFQEPVLSILILFWPDLYIYLNILFENSYRINWVSYQKTNDKSFCYAIYTVDTNCILYVHIQTYVFVGYNSETIPYDFDEIWQKINLRKKSKLNPSLGSLANKI